MLSSSLMSVGPFLAFIPWNPVTDARDLGEWMPYTYDAMIHATKSE
jgi:hypothetical protein